MSKGEPSARLFVLLARAAAVGVIFRRGPSKQVLMIRWDTNNDTFEKGQWLKGRVYERRCDLAPSGEKLIYFAANFKPPLYSWTGISKPPFFTALALWPKGDCWNGGGRFLTEKTIALNHPRNQSALQPGTYLKDIRVKKLADCQGEDDTVYGEVLQRDGWRLVTRAKWTQISKKYFAWKADPAQVHIKHRGKGTLALEMSLIGIRGEGPRWYQTSYRITGLRHQAKSELGLLDWADWDHSGDLVFAHGGKLFRQKIDNDDIENVQQVADFSLMKFEPVEAPSWAQHW